MEREERPEQVFPAGPRTIFADRKIGAYAVCQSADGCVLLIEANGGRLYLPGGRLEDGESPEQALAREMMEECGCDVTILDKIGEAEQAVHDGQYVIRGHYYAADLTRTACRGEHPSFWIAIAEAVDRVHRAADAWAIREAAGRVRPERRS